MAEQTYKIQFDGYWREVNKGGVPAESGIYCVYTCTHDKENKSVSLKSLIYIGESGNVHDRIAGHEKLVTWKKHLKSGQVLCYSFGGVTSASRVHCEAAMIYKHQPAVNTEYKNAFPFDQTTLTLSGKIAFLATDFTVKRKDL